MGANYQYVVVEANTTDELYKIYQRIHKDSQWEYGHRGYSGTFAEKEYLEVRSEKLVTWEEAYEDCLDNNDKWGPVWAYNLGEGRWYIGGWCSD